MKGNESIHRIYERMCFRCSIFWYSVFCSGSEVTERIGDEIVRSSTSTCIDRNGMNSNKQSCKNKL